jgi:hypothetical protein
MQLHNKYDLSDVKPFFKKKPDTAVAASGLKNTNFAYLSNLFEAVAAHSFTPPS